jgi:hypothetical protein
LKYRFTINKKILIYLLINAVLSILYSTIGVIFSNQYITNPTTILIFDVIILLIILKFTIAIYEFDSRSIISGMLFGKTIHFDKINKISIIKDYLLINSNQIGFNNHLKISLQLLNNNILKARKFLKEIRIRFTGDSRVFSEEILDFIDNDDKKLLYPDNYNIGGILLILLVFIILSVLSEISYLYYNLPNITDIDNQSLKMIALIRLIYIIFIIFIGIYTILLLIKKKKKAVCAIKIYSIAWFFDKIITEISAIISILINNQQLEMIKVYDSFHNIVLVLFNVLIVIQILKTSIRVKGTLVNE